MRKPKRIENFASPEVEYEGVGVGSGCLIQMVPTLPSHAQMIGLNQIFIHLLLFKFIQYLFVLKTSQKKCELLQIVLLNKYWLSL